MPDFYRLTARPTVVITTASHRGVTNAAPFSFNSPMASRPIPLYGFCCETIHDTWTNIRANGEFVVNLVGADFGPYMEVLERHYPYEVSELAECNLTEEPSKRIKPPRIAEAYGWIECKMKEYLEMSSRSVWVVGEVLMADVKEGYFDGVVDVEKADPLLHVWGDSFATGLRSRKFRRSSG